MAKVHRKRIGDLLVEASVVTGDELARALARQRETRERLGRVLVGMGLATEEEIAQALARQLGLQVVDLTTQRIDPAAMRLLPEAMARKHRLMPLYVADGALVVAMADPLDVFAIDDVEIAAKTPIKPVVATESQITAAIERDYGMGAAAQALVGEIGSDSPGAAAAAVSEGADEAPVVRLVNLILTQATKDRASDIHVEPGDEDIRVRYRVDGVLLTVMNLASGVHSSLIARVKVLARLNIAERRLPQDGAFEMVLDGRRFDFRVATIPTIHGERVAVRLLEKTRGLLSLELLGMQPAARQRYESLIHQPYGVILVSGPTGSGKTTTLVSSLAILNAVDRNIITIEDPVEYQLPGVNHIQVNMRAGLTFATGLRSIVRQDPDIIMIGEVRDVETAEIAVHASLTGQLVLTTIHTNDAPSALIRLEDMGIEPFLVASAVIGVVSQRLVRLLCPHCKTPEPVPAEIVAWLESMVKEPLPPPQFHRARGCAQCKHTGYLGRTGIYEVLVMSEPIRRLVLGRTSAADLADAARAEGMTTMRVDGMLKAMRGLTTVEEVLRVTRVEEPARAKGQRTVEHRSNQRASAGNRQPERGNKGKQHQRGKEKPQ